MEEVGLIGQLGIDWKLFLSQTVNFFILLLILRVLVYKPLLLIIKKRNEKIKQGLEKAEEADLRLKEIDVIAKERLKKADLESINIIKQTEDKAKELEQSLKLKAEEKQKELMHQIQVEFIRQQEEVRKDLLQEASELVKRFIVKTVELKPQVIDDALIEKAIKSIKNES